MRSALNFCYKNFDHELRTLQKGSLNMRGLRAPDILWAGTYNTLCRLMTYIYIYIYIYAVPHR
jgi:hypothetical protein